MQRAHQRLTHQLRPIKLTRHYTRYAEGSVLIEVGHTQVLCNASVSTQVPEHCKSKQQGWVTAEYAMLPRATTSRSSRQRALSSGRTHEIQRLIGRSLRASVELKKLAGYNITIDCDVLQADGGTRVASITGGYVALCDAISHLMQDRALAANPIQTQVAAVSVGMLQKTPLLDLDYAEDSSCEADVNVVLTQDKAIIEVQGGAEGTAIAYPDFQSMIDLAIQNSTPLFQHQTQALQDR